MSPLVSLSAGDWNAHNRLDVLGGRSLNVAGGYGEIKLGQRVDWECGF